MGGYTGPVTTADWVAAHEQEADGFFRRMRTMVGKGQFGRVAREAVLDPGLLACMREMHGWTRPIQEERTAREAARAAARTRAAAHFTAHRRGYVDADTARRMPARRTGAEDRTQARVRRNTENARAFWARVAADPGRVLAGHAARPPYSRWAILHPHAGPVRNPDEFWEARVNRDVRKARRAATRRNLVRPAGISLEQAERIAAAVLDGHGGRFPKPAPLPDLP